MQAASPQKKSSFFLKKHKETSVMTAMEHCRNICVTINKMQTFFTKDLIQLYMWRVWMRRGECIGSWWGSRRERDHWGDLGVDGRIILGWISRRWDVGIWTGLGWLRIESGGGSLWVRQWTFGFREMRGISWLAANQLASQEGPCTME